jgi:oligoribonuclease
VAQDQNNLVWLDMEMSGLDPEKERILEIAFVVTDSQLNTVVEAPIWVVHQSNEVLGAMDAWNKGTHGKSGLIDKVKRSTVSEAQAEQGIIAFLQLHVPKGASPLCGNSIHQDRRFLVKYMPKLEDYFHYRNIDTSTLKELAKRWAPAIQKGFVKTGKHQALSDVYESINEMKYYREHLMPITLQAPAA